MKRRNKQNNRFEFNKLTGCFTSSHVSIQFGFFHCFFFLHNSFISVFSFDSYTTVFWTVSFSRKTIIFCTSLVYCVHDTILHCRLSSFCTLSVFFKRWVEIISFILIFNCHLPFGSYIRSKLEEKHQHFNLFSISSVSKYVLLYCFD